jgi:hypothetical protein
MPHTGKDHAHWCPLHSDHEDGESPALQSIPTVLQIKMFGIPFKEAIFEPFVQCDFNL